MTGWLIDTLLYTGLLIGFVLAVRRPAGRIFGAQFAYLLWVLPFLRLLMPPIVLPASLAPEVGPTRAVAAVAPVKTDWAEVPPQSTGGAVSLPDYAPATDGASAASSWARADLAAVALSLWLGVALAFLAWRIVTYRRMRGELLAGARPVGEVGKVRLVETPAVPAPVAFGVLDKVIALPPLFMAQPDRAARDLAIEHELAHHRGQDLLANFAAQALLAIHWFNPLAWMGWRAMRRDQEAACDARVLAGRPRDERARYAALIAGFAAGPRAVPFKGALAAPMACPVLGDKSIIHRLRSLAMTDITRRRRWLGRSLIGAGAMALPLTASFSYAAGAQIPEPPAPPAPPEAVAPPAPLAPLAPPAPPAAVAAPGASKFIMHREVGEDANGAPIVRRFVLRRDGDAPIPPMPPMPRLEFHGAGSPDSPEFRARMEEFRREMEEWGERFGEEHAALAEEQAERWAEAGRNAPEVVESCDEKDLARPQAADGRRRVVICQRDVQLAARSSLRAARNSIARNRDIGEAVRNEILRDLDQEIERIERND